MNNTDWALEVSSFGLVLLVVLGILLFGLLRFVRRALDRLNMSAARREAVESALPVVEALVGLVYLLSTVPLVFDDHPQYSPIGLGLILLGFAWVSWFAIRDFVNGAFLKAGRLMRVGDQVRFGELRGELSRLGYRTLSLELNDGAEAIIPYGRVTRDSLVRTPHAETVWRHSFNIPTPQHVSASEGCAQIRRTVLNHHWTAASKSPEVRVHADHFEVIVHALSPERGAEIQVAVENALTTNPPT